MINSFTIDLEDWFCSHNLHPYIKFSEWDKYESRVAKSTLSILTLLKKYEVEATFFVLGWIAEKLPDLIKEIEAHGHEIASHGYGHQLLTNLNESQFREDVQRALDVTCPLISKDIKGFRAPAFSITKDSLWAIPALKSMGFTYDSSVYPISVHPDYGIPSSELDIYSFENGLIEVPMSCAVLAGTRIPCSGGGYFRFMNYGIFKRLMRRCNEQGRSVIYYLHPWEIDPGIPKMELPWFKKFRHYNNLGCTMRRLELLLEEFDFTSMEKLLKMRSGEYEEKCYKISDLS